MKLVAKVTPFVPSFLKDRVARMRRERKFKKLKSGQPITKERILNNLRKLGLKEGDVIFVHSSLTSIGYVGRGAETVIDALIETVGPGGTLAMPSFSYAGSMLETLERGLVFDPKRSPSVVGAITEAFRKRQGVYRSIHPTHSVCAWGAKAEWITAGHEKASTNFGPGTPLHKIMEEGGLIVGLGVDFGPVTFVHIIEDTIDNFPIEVYCEREYDVSVINGSGREIVMKVKAHDPKISKTRIDHWEGKWIRNFFTEYLVTKGFLRTGYVGKAKCWVIKAKDLFEAQKELLRRGITVYTTKEEYKRGLR